MPAINLKNQPEIVPSGLSAKMGVGNEAGLDLLAPLALNNPIDLEDIVYYDNGGDILYKGVVQTMDHNLDDEGIDSSTIGVEQYINTQPWEAVNRFYNDTESTCTVSFNEGTIADFILAEFVNDVPTWLTEIFLDEAAPGDIGDLLLPRLDLLNVGFMDAIESLLKPHPFLRWTFEYSDPTVIFPAGRIVIFSAQDGRDTHVLEVGGVNGTVTDLNVTQSSTETAKHVEVHARGKFVERFEIAQPFWSQYEESIPEFGVEFPMPNSEGAGVSIPQGHDFPQTVHLFAVNVEAEYAQGGIIHQSAFRIYPGTDYIIDMETGQITFLTPEEGDSWPWVDAETGEETSGDYYNFGGIAVGISNARRPVAYMNAHLNEGSDTRKLVRAFYFRPNDLAYKQYRMRHPIADFRIRKEYEDGSQPDNPAVSTENYVLRREPESIDVYVPNLERMREAEDEDPEPRTNAELSNQVLNADWDQLEADDGTWYRQDPQGNGEITAPTISPLAGYILNNTNQVNLIALQRYFTKLEGSASFEEGDYCINLSNRQLAAYPKVYVGGESDDDTPFSPFGGGIPSGLDDTLRIARARWITWPILVHYTSWEECIEARTTAFGGERYYRGIHDSVFKYVDQTGLSNIEGNTATSTPPPITVFDNTGPGSPHAEIADEAADYFGTPYWTGRIGIAVLRVGQTPSNPASNAPFIIPYKIGDTCTIIGNVSNVLQSEFLGLIVAINYDRLEEGILELEFGRREPRLNPFLPRDDLPLNIEDDNLTGTETAGMRKLGGSQ